MKQQFRTSIFTALITAIIKLPFLPIIIYWRLLRRQTLATIVFTISTIIIGISIFHYTIIKTLPDIETIYEYKPKLSSKIYDRNSNLIFEIGTEKRVYVKINEIPPMLIKAFLAAEDKAFYEHKGVDLISLSKIMLLNVIKFAKHEKLAGASTITQQIVRNILLTNERTITRKIKEFILSYQISKELTKDQILELYLNHIYLGLQSYGVVSAANNYFGKTLEQLTIAEMATLASMPKAPSAMNPKRNKSRLTNRRNWILGEMLKTNFITQEQYNENIDKDIIIQHKENNFYPFYAPATFAKNIITNSDININDKQIAEEGYKIQLTIDGEIQRIAQQALEKAIITYTKDHGYNGVIKNVNLTKDYKFNNIIKSINITDEYDENFEIGLVIKVENNFVNIQLSENTFGKITLDDMKWARKKISETELGPIIKKCQDVLKEGDIIFVKHKGGSFYTLEETPTINGGVIILDSKNNNILAMVGGYKDQAGGFNRAVQAFRQLGSSAKPFVYATALEEGVQPNSIFMDSEISINLANGSIWTPENDTKTTLGPVTLRTGLEKSLNTVTIRIADKIGINKIVNKLKEFGLNNNIERNLSIALGTFESSLLNTALAYSVFINNGQLVPATIITGIKNDVYNVDVSNLKILNMQKENMYKTINVKLDTKVDERENQNTEAKIEGDEKVDNIKNREDLDQSQIISKATAYQILSILEGAVARGTAHRLRDLRIPLAAKTGTTDNGQTIWTAAVTPEIIILSYIGHDIPKNTNNYGGQYPLQIVKDMLSTLKDSIKFTDFIAPEGVKYMKINKVNGKKATSSTKESNIIYEVLKIDDKTPETDVNEIETNNSDDAIVQY